jgi:HSP20 family protein
MSNLRLFDPLLSDPFENILRRIVVPIRMDLENRPTDMRVDGNIIQIEAQTRRKKNVEHSGGRLLVSERLECSASRPFALAQDVDDTKTTAKYEDGVLTLELPKKSASDSTQTTIQWASSDAVGQSCAILDASTI